MKKKLLKKMGFCAGMLLCGVSGNSLMQNFVKENITEFSQTQVVIDKDSISIQQFYENLTLTSKGWVYTNKEGKKYNVDSLCDYRHQEEQKQKNLRQLKAKKQIDTIYVSFEDEKFKEKEAKKIIYKNASSDSLANMPSMGINNYDMITIREFVADNPKLQKIMDNYNDSHNATYAHEAHHLQNTKNGMRTWNSYSIKFVECFLDEISVNIAQCLKQRENYLNNGKNLDYITERFSPYKEAVKRGKFVPSKDSISEKEQEFIANSVFDKWMKDKYNSYYKQEMTRTKFFLKDAPYPAIIEDKDKHNALMEKFFNIQGYNFWKYISKRENEIFAKITPEMKAEWKILEQAKYEKLSYLEKLEVQKIIQGKEKFNQTLNKNKVTSRLISTFSKDR